MACRSCGGSGVIRVARSGTTSDGATKPIVVRKTTKITTTKTTSTRPFSGVRSARDVDKYRDQ